TLTYSNFILYSYGHLRYLHSFPTRRSSDLVYLNNWYSSARFHCCVNCGRRSGFQMRSWPNGLSRATRSVNPLVIVPGPLLRSNRSEEHTSELQSRSDLVCRLLLEKKNI